MLRRYELTDQDGNRLHLYSLRKRLENPGVLQRITVPCLTGWSGSHVAVLLGATF